MKQDAVIEMGVHHFPSFLRSRKQALLLDAWMNGDQYAYSADNVDVDDPGYGRAFNPNVREVNREYENLRGLSPNNFAGLIATTMSQMAYIEGICRPGTIGTLPIWDSFQRNRWMSRQSAIHRSAAGQGVAYGVVLPGKDPLTGSPMSKMLGKSANQMAAFYDNDDDEWPIIAIEALPTTIKDADSITITGKGGKNGWAVKIYDDYVVHRLLVEGDGTEAKQWKYVDFEQHNMPVPPVARAANRLDLDGNSRGEIEPVLPLLRRIDQDLFDRLINQRFGAWQVRYIAGMAKPDSKTAEAAQALKLRVEDLLVSTDNQTKFGTLPAGDIKNQIEATDADLRLLSAITQMPPHHLMGLSSNLQAEALAAATEGLQRKSFDFRTNMGEFHEQMARLAAMADGDFVLAAAWDLRVRWKDTESGSMSQAADALGKLAVQLKVPVEMLWERIPGWTDTDVQRAKELVEDGGLERMLAELIKDTNDIVTPPSEQGPSDGNTD
jgi:hypothetical protein